MENNKRHSDSENMISETKVPERRVSLAGIFSGALIGILAIFILVNSVLAYRISDFQSILRKLSTNVLPKATLSGEAVSRVNQLTYLTARIAASPSQSFRLIAYRDIRSKINEISDLKLIANEDHRLKSQLESIIDEFEGLNLLIEERIQYKNQVMSQKENLYALHAQVIESVMNSEKNRHSYQNFIWTLDFSDIVALSSKSLAVARLNQVRRISKQIKNNFAKLKLATTSVQLNNTINARNLVRRLESIVVLEGGLLPTRIRELRSIGQSTGRSNFVHNLVEDFARQVQFQSHQSNELIIGEAKTATQKLDTEADLIKLMTIVTFIFLFIVLFYLHKKIIRRLVNLNLSVKNRINGGDLNIRLTGNDEISDIANSFDLLIEEIEEQKLELEKLSLTDGLTGIANRRYLDEHLTKKLQLAKLENTPLSVLMMDVDSFKNFNDHYGHLAGDDCLKKIAQAFKSAVQRKEDFVARFGGEEFVLILPDTTRDGAEKIAKEMLESVISMKITHEWNSASPYVTLSIGGATFQPSDSIDDSKLLKRADEALFRAKEKGKNCFVAFDIS